MAITLWLKFSRADSPPRTVPGTNLTPRVPPPRAPPPTPSPTPPAVAPGLRGAYVWRASAKGPAR